MPNGNSWTTPVPAPLELKTSGCHAGSLLMTGELLARPGVRRKKRGERGEGGRDERGHEGKTKDANGAEQKRIERKGLRDKTNRSKRLMRAALPCTRAKQSLQTLLDRNEIWCRGSESNCELRIRMKCNGSLASTHLARSELGPAASLKRSMELNDRLLIHHIDKRISHIAAVRKVNREVEEVVQGLDLVVEKEDW